MTHQKQTKARTEIEKPGCNTRIQFAVVVRATCDQVKTIADLILNSPNTNLIYQRVSTKFLRIVEEDYPSEVD